MQETQETRVQSLGQEDPLEEGMATRSSILAWKNPIVRGDWRATVHGVRVGHDSASTQSITQTASGGGGVILVDQLPPP